MFSKFPPKFSKDKPKTPKKEDNCPFIQLPLPMPPPMPPKEKIKEKEADNDKENGVITVDI